MKARGIDEDAAYALLRRAAMDQGKRVAEVAGALLRAPNLDYSEFQGDEARVMLRASEVIEGYENALFAHQKMPEKPGLIFIL